MSDTPRTDAEAFCADGPTGMVVPADFARQLERELCAPKRREALSMLDSRFLYEDADAPLASAILTRAEYELLVEALKEAPKRACVTHGRECVSMRACVGGGFDETAPISQKAWDQVAFFKGVMAGWPGMAREEDRQMMESILVSLLANRPSTRDDKQ